MLSFAAVNFALLLLGPTQEVSKTLNRYVDAVRTFNSSSLDQLFHPAYTEISPLGQVDSREQTLGYYRVPKGQNPVSPESIAIDELAIRFASPEVAVAHYREIIVIDRNRTLRFRVTAVLKRDAVEWKLFHVQAVGMRP